MIIVKSKEGQKIDVLLKLYKNKFKACEILKNIKDKQEFVKPSAKKRQQKIKAVYINKMNKQENENTIY